MPVSRNASPWYRLHHLKPHEGRIELFIIPTGDDSINPSPSLPSRLTRALKRLLPASCKLYAPASICYFTNEPTVAEYRHSAELGVRLQVTIHREEGTFMKELKAIGFQPLPPNTSAHFFL